MPAANILIFKRTTTATPPVVPLEILTYTYATGVLSGALDGWEQSLPVSGGAYRWVASTYVISDTLTIPVATNKWRPPSLIAIDGKCSHTATVYKQVDLNPGSPSASTSSYDFATGILVPPTDWTVVQPDTTTVNTWAVDYTFIGLYDDTVIGSGSWGPTRIAAVAGIDGQNIHVITIYQKAPIRPETPEGGDYLFSSDAFVAPLGWYRELLALDTTPTWAATYRFATNTPDVVMTAGSWTMPVILSQQGVIPPRVFKSIVFKRSLDTPDTPIGGSYDYSVPEGWSEGIPPFVPNTYLWMTTNVFNSDDSDPQLWTTPERISNPTVGSALQFSEDGNNWHSEALLTDVYMRSGSSIDGIWTYSGMVKIKGETGDQGPEGYQGNQLYTWIAYADEIDGTGNFTTGSIGPTNKCIGISNNNTSSEESTDPFDYNWSVIQGTAGVPGTPGADGLTTYTWFAYANSPDGSVDFTTDAWTDQIYLGLAVNKLTDVESQTYTDYAWSKIGGAAGSASFFSIKNGVAMFVSTADVIAPADGVLLETIFVNIINVTGYVWRKNGVVLDGETNTYYTVPASDFTTSTSNTYSCTVTGTIGGESGVTLSDAVTIPKLTAGTSAPTVILSNESSIIKAPNTGYVGCIFDIGCTVTAYLGTTQLTYAASGANTFSCTNTSTNITVADGSGTGSVYTIAAPTAVSADTSYTTVTTTIRDAAGNAVGSPIVKIISYVVSRAGATGLVKGICFLRSAEPPQAPIGGSYTDPNGTGWSDGIPALDGSKPAWMSTRTFHIDGTTPPQDAAWSTPVNISQPAQGVKLQFSLDGITDWHDEPAIDDRYMRTATSDDNGVTWVYTGVVKIKGEDGPAAEVPVFFSTPTGAGYFQDTTHLGYYDNGAWQSYMDIAGNLYGCYLTAENITGTFITGKTIRTHADVGINTAGIKITPTGMFVYKADNSIPFSVDAAGNVSVTGNITMAAGSTISWSNITTNGTPPTNIANNQISLDTLGYTGATNATANQSDSITNAAIGTASTKANQDGIILFPGGGKYTTQVSSVNGRLKITLPALVPATLTPMLNFEVDVYENASSASCNFKISGHISGVDWYNVAAVITGGTIEHPVIFGNDGSKFCIWIGTVRNWSYPQVLVRNVQVGYSSTAQSNWENGWAVGFTATAPVRISHNITESSYATKITKNTVTTAYVNALNVNAKTVSADWVYAGSLTADQIFTNALTSNNYVSGSAGWSIARNGAVEFNGGTWRGPVIFTSGSSGYSNLSDKPTSLSAISPTDASTLSSAASTAATAYNTANSAAGTANATAASASGAINMAANVWTRPGQTTIDGNKISTGNLGVDTLQIKGNAVIIPVSAYTAAAVSQNFSYLSSATTTIQLQTVSITIPSGIGSVPVIIMTDVFLYGGGQIWVDEANTGYALWSSVSLYRGGTALRVGSTSGVMMYKETLAAGTYTYYLYGVVSCTTGGSAGPTVTCYAKERSIVIMGTLR